MEPVNAWESIINQSPLIAFMSIVIIAGAKYINEQNKKNQEREDAREERYNALVDKTVTMQQNYMNPLIEVIKSNTKVMERVERKLNEN